MKLKYSSFGCLLLFQAVKRVHEYNSLETEEERKNYVKSTHGSSLVTRYQSTEGYKQMMKSLSSQVKAKALKKNREQSFQDYDDDDSVVYQTSFFKQVSNLRQHWVTSETLVMPPCFPHWNHTIPPPYLCHPFPVHNGLLYIHATDPNLLISLH